MSNSYHKAYRRAQKRRSDRNYNKYILDYVEWLCVLNFRMRIVFCWRIMKRRNPDTNKVVKRPKKVKK